MMDFKLPIKGLLFDMDGTVLDTEGLFDKAIIKLLKKKRINTKKYNFSEFVGLSYKDFYPRFMKKFKLDENIETVRLNLRTYLHEIMQNEIKFIEGFESFYKSYVLNKSFRVGLVTNTTRATYKKIQKFINIDDYFNYVITATESKKPKPSSEPYLQAMKDLCIKPSETIIVEDSITGLLSAIRSGAHTVGLMSSLDANQIKKISSNIHIIRSYDDLKI